MTTIQGRIKRVDNVQGSRWSWVPPTKHNPKHNHWLGAPHSSLSMGPESLLRLCNHQKSNVQLHRHVQQTENHLSSTTNQINIVCDHPFPQCSLETWNFIYTQPVRRQHMRNLFTIKIYNNKMTTVLRRICKNNIKNNKMWLNLLNALTNSNTGDVYLRLA